MLRLTPRDCRVMPWKNGGGSTTELLIRPEGFSLSERFLFRVSLADVASSGPFSTFEGCDRHLVIVSGTGLRLSVGGRQLALEPFQPVFFSGDDAASGALVDGPVRDFNVIVDRTRATATLVVTQLAAPLWLACAPGETVVVHVLEGALNGATPGDTLVLDASHTVTPAPGPARVVLARISPRPG
ncbi:MAG: HutD family protein [Myxococcaceae bacterium]|nr:HutD family protein [Myxococcaceae bacterium]